MSIEALNWAWKLTNVPRALKLELLALADSANDLGVSFVCLSRIAERTDTSVRSVRRNLRELEQLLGIRTLTRGRRGEKNGSNLFILPIPGVDQSAMTAFLKDMSNGYEIELVTKPPLPDTSVLPDTHVRDLPDTSVLHIHNNNNYNQARACVREIPQEPKGGKTPAGKKDTLLPNDWDPPPETLASLQKHGIDVAFALNQLDEFRIYWHERQAAKKSWSMTFINWVKNAHKDAQHRGSHHGKADNYRPAPQRRGPFAGRQTGAQIIGDRATNLAAYGREDDDDGGVCYDHDDRND